MRKNLILTAATFAALAFVGCSHDDVLNESSSVNKPIEFGTYLGRDAQTSRASVVTETDVQTSGFGVYAYYTKNIAFADYTDATPNFMNNQQVTYKDDNWVYSPVKYWPNNTGDKVSFFAYAPYDANYALNDDSTIDFTVENTVTSQTDLLWNKTQQVDVTKQNIAGKVRFDFAHALSRIGFTVQCAADQVDAGGNIAQGTTVTVEKVILSGEAHKYEAGAKVTEPAAGAFYQSGKLNLNSTTAAWSNQTGAQAFTLVADNFKTVTLDSTNNTQQSLNKDDSYLMVIPQNFAADQLYVYVQYKVTTTDGKDATNSSEITNYISTPVAIDFQAGKAYTLNLVLGLTEVKIEAGVDVWDEQAGTEVNLPENEA